jgi:hypothetical protein
MASRDFAVMTMFALLIGAGMVATTRDGARAHEGLWVAQAIR